MSMSPGSLLDNRYRLEVLLSEHDGARFWRATDTVLARSVAVHVVPSEDPRAPRVLAAARASAAVSDPHFLRVLDCEDVDGLTWVINEWGDGVSLDVMLARGTLPAMRAAWLTREVALAIVAAHAKGLCHGRLNPEAVLVTESGSVKLIGFVVNAAFERTPTTPSPYGAISPRDADVVDLAGILYAALTGKWPGVAPSAVAAAPRDGVRPLRPRQVRAGVPRTLDAICDRVLHKEASQHAMPIETALEIAAALSDFVGDPASVAPVDVPSMHDEPGAPLPADPGETAVAAPLDLAAAGLESPTGLASPAPSAAPSPAAPSAPPPTPPPPAPAPSAAEDPDATMAAPPPYALSGIEFLEPEAWEPSAPPPPFEQKAARPLFADAERRVPEAAPVVTAPTPPVGIGTWSADNAPTRREYDEPRRRTGLKVTLVILVAIAVIVALYLAFIKQNTSSPASSAGSGTPTTVVTTPAPSPTPSLTGAAVAIKQVGDFDPEGNPPQENPGQVGLAIDGNPATAWSTSRYTSATFGGLKSGVGMVVDLGSQQPVSSIEVKLLGSPTDLEFYAADQGVDAPPAELAAASMIGRVTGAGTTAALQLVQPRTTRFIIIWLTRLPAVNGGFAGKIAEIMVRS